MEIKEITPLRAFSLLEIIITTSDIIGRITKLNNQKGEKKFRSI